MARKKAAVTEEEKVVEADPKTKDQATSVNSSIKYTGTVTIKYVSKSGKVKRIVRHNAGKPDLFSGLLRQLAKYDSQSYLPNGIQLYVKSASSSALTKCLSQPVVITSVPTLLKDKDKSTTNPNKILYTFNIAPQTILDRTYQVTHLALVNDRFDDDVQTLADLEDQGICATLELDSTSYISLDSGATIVIYWQLEFN